MSPRRGLLLLALTLVASSAHARRVPSVGGKIVLALPDDMVQETIDAHLHVPIVERNFQRAARDRIAHPALPDWPGWRSAVLLDIAASEDLKTWILTGMGPAMTLGSSLQSCFSDSEAGRWPAQVMKAADITVDVKVIRDTVTLSFTRPVGPLPELLEGCLLTGATGVYHQTGKWQLDARDGHVHGPPPMRRVELRKLGEPADLVGGSPLATGVGTLLTPFPDVLLLLQPKALREKDPLDLGADAGALKTFRSELRPDLLVSIFWAGRGGPALGILPPGLAPARPLPDPAAPGRPLPLTLGSLSSAAERIAIVSRADDGLAEGVVERIAVLLRTRGFGTEQHSPGDEAASTALHVLRWRPPTADPGLAMLVLAGEHPSIVDDEQRVAFQALLAPTLESRLEAAMAIERQWIEARTVVPLLVAERWFAFDPDLRGVAVRADGIPLLGRAWWGGKR